MFPGINQKQMQQAMKQMGMKQIEIEAEEVIIRQGDKDIIISNPSVQKIKMMGQESYQITGDESIQERIVKLEINDDDIKTVMEQAGVSEDKAKQALEEAEGDIATAILSLQ